MPATDGRSRRAPQVCDRIDPSAEGSSAAWSPRGYQISSLRSSCYRSVAWDLHDPTLCDQATPAKTAALDGSKMDKAECLAGARGSGGGEIAVPHAMEPFVRYMRRLGYDDPRVAADRYHENPENNKTYAAYERLRTDPAFIERRYRQDARSRVPAPTPDDYWEFLPRMKFNGSADDRRRLLRKVMALR